MKKFITAFMMAAVCSLGSFAQSLVLVHADKEYTSGTVTSTEAEIDEDFGSEMIGGFFLKNKSNATKSVKTTLNVQGGDKWLFCFGGSCESNTSFDKKADMAANELADLQIHYSFDVPCEPFETVADFTAECVGEAGSKISLKLVMKYNGSSISTSVLNNDVKVVDNVLHYDLEEGAALSIFDLSGKEIDRMMLEGKAGQIDLNYLKEGLYIYKLNTEKPVAGKFIIK